MNVVAIIQKISSTFIYIEIIKIAKPWGSTTDKFYCTLLYDDAMSSLSTKISLAVGENIF